MSGQKVEVSRGTTVEDSSDGAEAKISVGIFVRDAMSRRLIEGATIQLGLVPRTLDEESLRAGEFHGLELLIADEAAARKILERRGIDVTQTERINPALIAVRDRGVALDGTEPEFDGVLLLPQELAPITAQLSLYLYAHRAFAKRYESALEELQLNRRIFRSVTSGISVANAQEPDMPLVYVNPAFEVMTGYSLEEVRGKNCRFLQSDDIDQPGLTLVREALRSKREVIAILKNYRKDGRAFWNELALSPIWNREGILTHFVGIQMDVTARVEFEAALRQSEKLAAVGRLAASIAHEINNPLESVMNLLYLAEGSDSIEEIRGFLGTADQELRRVALITSQSLRFYRQSTKPQAVRCNDLLESVIDLYQARFSNEGVTLERRERMAQSIVCLESEVRQVLSNLIRNAIDAMHGTGGRLLIRSRESTHWPSGTKGALITVADTGTGISPETMGQMYTAFFSTKGIGGTGLGLWVSSEIINRHQGHLRVRSRQADSGNGWTIFQLFLPFQGLAA